MDNNVQRIYSALDASKQQFRLMRFNGGRNTLSWELGTMSIHDEISWTALSYCWGSSEPTEKITLNGEDFAVRPNLYKFLVQMASENRRDWFFVDAICINQTDLAERSSQVALMGDIYRNAEEVIAWIYHEQDDSSDKVLSQVDIEQWLGYLRDREQKGTLDKSEADKLRKEISDMARQRAFCSDYWSRLWIVQEILLAKKLIIRWMSLTIEWSDILSLDIDGATVGEVHLAPDGRPSRPNVIMAARKAQLWKYKAMAGSGENAIMCKQLWYWKQSAGTDLRAGKLLALHEAVEFFSVQSCRQAHDSIFGLLGIAHSNIQPQYTMPLVELYTRALYGSLLSRWSERPMHADPANKPLDDKEFIQSLGWSWEQLASLGGALLHSLQLDPFHEVLFLVTQVVCDRFASGRAMYRMLFFLFRSRIMAIEYLRLEPMAIDDEGSLLKTRPDESEDEAVQRFNDDMLARLKQADARQSSLAWRDRKMEGPEVDGREMRWGAWVDTTRSVCDDVWSAFDQGTESAEKKSSSPWGNLKSFWTRAKPGSWR